LPPFSFAASEWQDNGTAIMTAQLFAALLDQTLRQARETATAPDARVARVALAREALAAHRADKALPLLAELGRAFPADPEIALLRGVALRREQRFLEAAEVFAAARAAGAEDPALLEGLAQTRFELGQPAAALFAEAQLSDPGNLDVVRNRANAMAAEGDLTGAEQLLEAQLAAAPGWFEGHKALSVLRWTRGDQPRFAESYVAALKAEPRNAGLWLAWFRALAQTRDWAAATAVLDAAEAALGQRPDLVVARLFVASESGDGSATEALLAETSAIEGETINLIRVRHALRLGRPDAAERVALPQLITASAPLFWPYLSLAWRMRDDPRAHWIDRPEQFIQPCRVDLSAAELAELAKLLRTLHTMERPYIEQSVRGGTQTDRSVIQRHEPIVQRAKRAWLEAIRGYVEALPPYEQGHPLLGLPRGQLLVEGSWSVRLLRQGYNVPHNHPVGWLSTAFYIALPAAAAMGPAPAGYIAFGTPPEELGLDLPAYCTIVPEVGVTAVFPSTMWHRTLPFADGERLALALDVRRPLY
jgi:tetratricopeptide (TPR) repeat protein